VPHDVVEPKTGSKKKLVMQPDRDAQVCGIFLFVFLSTPCFEILLLLLFWRKVMLHSFFMLFDCSTYIFSKLHEHILFFNDPSVLCKITRREISLDFGVFILVDGWNVLRSSRCGS
jgi:hypothetical protein